MPSADRRRGARNPWSGTGMTRRHFVVGLGLAGAAAFAGELVTTRVALAATPDATANTVVVVFLRGGADGLRILVPNAASLGLTYLSSIRDNLVPRDGQLIALDGGGGWALHAAMKPLHDALWAGGELAFVPAVGVPGVTRSHFQAERHLETGGVESAPDGWLDRVLEQVGPGTSFRALSAGWRSPISMAGNESKLAMTSLADFALPGTVEQQQKAQAVLAASYAQAPAQLRGDVASTLAALSTIATIRAQGGPRNGAVYPPRPFGKALADVSAVLRAEVGLRVATVDVGGWDTHTDEIRQLDKVLPDVAAALAAFMADLGPERRKRVTVVVQTEFGRRVAINASGGTDHGAGGVMWLLGGGVAGRAVHGAWRPLMTKDDLENGDVPRLNNAFDVLGEVVAKRLGVGSLGTVFPGHTHVPLGIVRSA